MLLLIDGYNIAQPVAPSRRPPANWLQLARENLLQTLAKYIDQSVRSRTCIVFDAADPPKGRPSQFQFAEMEVRFAVDYVTADDLLEEIIRSHHTPKQLMVVSSDHRVQVAAKRRGATFIDSEPWMDRLTDGRTILASDLTTKPDGKTGQGGAGEGSAKPRIEDPDEVQQWMKEFGFDP
ncbi:MAG: NYN domain-containing protein [Planctomycetota bacterium]